MRPAARLAWYALRQRAWSVSWVREGSPGVSMPLECGETLPAVNGGPREGSVIRGDVTCTTIPRRAKNAAATAGPSAAAANRRRSEAACPGGRPTSTGKRPGTRRQPSGRPADARHHRPQETASTAAGLTTRHADQPRRGRCRGPCRMGRLEPATATKPAAVRGAVRCSFRRRTRKRCGNSSTYAWTCRDTVVGQQRTGERHDSFAVPHHIPVAGE